MVLMAHWPASGTIEVNGALVAPPTVISSRSHPFPTSSPVVNRILMSRFTIVLGGVTRVVMKAGNPVVEVAVPRRFEYKTELSSPNISTLRSIVEKLEYRLTIESVSGPSPTWIVGETNCCIGNGGAVRSE